MGQPLLHRRGSTIALRTNETGTAKLSFLAADHHGTSSIAVTGDSTQALTKRYTTPFGATRGQTTGAWPDDKGFLGKPADTATGLTDLRARQYDPTIGRFISVDPILDTSDPQSLNGYSYAGDNPVTYSDPTGTIRANPDGTQCRGGWSECGPGDVRSGNSGSSSTSGTGQSVGSTTRSGNTTATTASELKSYLPVGSAWDGDWLNGAWLYYGRNIQGMVIGMHR